MARHLEGALGPISAAVQAVLLAVRGREYRAWLARLQAAGGHLRHPRTHLHNLLFRVFPRYPAAAGHLRKDQTGPEFNFGIRSGREAVSRRRISRCIQPPSLSRPPPPLPRRPPPQSPTSSTHHLL